MQASLAVHGKNFKHNTTTDSKKESDSFEGSQQWPIRPNTMSIEQWQNGPDKGKTGRLAEKLSANTSHHKYHM
jgi:hypothetical protein